jgi:hypothetical protein
MNNFRFLKHNLSILNNKSNELVYVPRGWGYNVFSKNIEQYINEDLLKLLIDNGLKPNLIVLFKGNLNIRNTEKSLLHADVYYNIKNKKYQYHYCGLNQELTNSKAIFHWWQPINAKPIYPSIANIVNEDRIHLDGIHYESRSKFFKNPEEKFKLLETTNYDNQKLILARTDIPHSVIYESEQPRLSVSLRFDTSLFNSWNDVLNRFERLL